MPAADRQLSTAGRRRTQILVAAAAVFAGRGFFGTTTVEIAKAAGLSQAYLYRLFPDKQTLFIAVIDHAVALTRSAWAEALDARDQQRARGLDGLYEQYLEIARTSVLPSLLLHAVGASAEPAIREAVRRCYDKQVSFLKDRTDATDGELQEFFARSMLANVLLSIDAQDSDAPWARSLGSGLL